MMQAFSYNIPPMKQRELKRLLKVLGFSQVKAGKFLGITARQVRRHTAGERPIPVAVATLLRLMAVLGLMPDDVLKKVKKPAA